MYFTHASSGGKGKFCDEVDLNSALFTKELSDLPEVKIKIFSPRKRRVIPAPNFFFSSKRPINKILVQRYR